MMLRSAAFVFALLIADLVSAQQAVILVRHAEKETDPAKLKGVADKDVPLNEAGAARAKALAEHLKDAKIDAVYTSFAKRTQETAAPLAKAAEKKPMVIGRDSIAKLGERHKDDVVLIKVSAQWWNQGMTNVAAVKRTIEQILTVPGFTGEVIVFENTHFLKDGSPLTRAFTKASDRNVDVPGWSSMAMKAFSGAGYGHFNPNREAGTNPKRA